MTPELIPSKTLMRAAQADRARLARALARSEARRAELEAELEAISKEQQQLKERDRLLQSVGGSGPQGRTSEDDGAAVSSQDVLRGAQIREQAARLFYHRYGAGTPRHYRQWFELLIESGVEISGKDPMATFLTNLSRSPLVVRGDEVGTYAIDSEAPARLREKLAELHAELVDLAGVIARDDDPGQELLNHRAELMSAIRKQERLIAEADRVLNTSTEDDLAKAA